MYSSYTIFASCTTWHLYTLQNGQPVKSSNHLSPCKVIAWQYYIYKDYYWLYIMFITDYATHYIPMTYNCECVPPDLFHPFCPTSHFLSSSGSPICSLYPWVCFLFCLFIVFQNPHVSEIMGYCLSLSDLLHRAEYLVSIHVVASGMISHFSYGQVIFCCVYIRHFLYPFIHQRMVIL